MKSKYFGLLLAGATAVAAASAKADSVGLTIVVDPVAQTWNAYANVSGTGGPGTAGLAGIQFDITATGNLALTSTQDPTAPSLNDLPTGVVSTAAGSKNAGFYVLNGSSDLVTSSAGVTDEQFAGAQSNTFLTGKTAGHTDIVKGFGQVTSGLVGDASTTWGDSNGSLIANGTFTGTLGTLSVSGSPTTTTLLPSVLPTANNASIQTHSPTVVTGQTVQVGQATAAPIPAGVWGGSVVFGVLGFLRKFRKA